MFLTDVAIAILLKISGFQVSELLTSLTSSEFSKYPNREIYTFSPKPLKFACPAFSRLISFHHAFTAYLVSFFIPPLMCLLYTFFECSFDPLVLALQPFFGKVFFLFLFNPMMLFFSNCSKYT